MQHIFLPHELIRSGTLNLWIFYVYLGRVLLLLSKWILVSSRDILCKCPSFKINLGIISLPGMWSNLVSIPCSFEKTMYSLVIRCDVLFVNLVKVNCLFSFTLFFKLIFLGVLLLYNVMLVSAEQQSESAICVYIHLFSGFPFHLGHHRARSRVPCAIQ